MALLCLLITGCATSLTNLTTSQQPRNPKGLYPVEVMWQSDAADIVKDTIKGYVVVGFDAYPMQRSPMLTNRWEALLPVPTDKNLVNFRYKFDYQYLTIPVRRPGSKMSESFQLQILDR